MGLVRYPTEHLVIGDYWNLWERSVPLNAAFHSFGPPEDIVEYRRLKAERPSFHLGHLIDGLYKTVGQETVFSAEAQSYKDFNSSPSGARLKELEKTLKNRIQSFLRTRQLFAIGFNTPRKAGDVPSLIPADSLQSYIWWDNDKIQHGSLKMENVRIGLGSWIEDILSAKTEASHDPIEDREPETIVYGRPSKRNLMWKAYLECVEAGKIDFSQLKADAYRTVIAHIRKTYPEQYENGKGLGEKTFLRATNEHFDAKALELKRD